MEVMKHFLLIKIKHIHNFAYVRLMPLEGGWKYGKGEIIFTTLPKRH